MNIEINTIAYNHHRYGKPCIARMTIRCGDLAPRWGIWIGDAGGPGLLTLDGIEPGDVIMRGQRDRRIDVKSVQDYYLVGDEMELTRISKVDAYYQCRLRADEELNDRRAV